MDWSPHVALTCYSTRGNWAPEAGSAIPPGRSCRAVVSVHPIQTQQVAPSSKQPMTHLTVSSLSLGHALLAWYLSRQSKA